MNRRNRLAVAAAVLLTAAGTVACDDTTAADDQCDVAETVPEKPVSGGSAPGGGEVRVEEHGFTQLPEPDGALSIGAVLRNTSDRIAYRTRVVFRLRSGSDTSMAEDGPQSLTKVIPVMMPGEAVGVGAGPSVEGGVTSVSVQVGTTTWLSRGDLGEDFAAATTEYLRTIRYDPENQKRVAVHYTETSPSCRALENRGTAVVFRGANGEIVGGDVAEPDLTFRDVGTGATPPESRPPSSLSCSPGKRETWIVPSFEPATADSAHTQLYSYCDLNLSGDYTN